MDASLIEVMITGLKNKIKIQYILTSHGFTVLSESAFHLLNFVTMLTPFTTCLASSS